MLTTNCEYITYKSKIEFINQTRSIQHLDISCITDDDTPESELYSLDSDPSAPSYCPSEKAFTYITAKPDYSFKRANICSLHSFTQKPHPILKNFLSLNVKPNITNSAQQYSPKELTQIKDFCANYGLLLNLNEYINNIETYYGALLSPESKEELFPHETVSSSNDAFSEQIMPLCFFEYYQHLIQNICELHKLVYINQTHALLNNSYYSIADNNTTTPFYSAKSELVFHFLSLLLQPYHTQLPKPYDHYVNKATPLARFASHYKYYLDDHCLTHEKTSPDIFWENTGQRYTENKNTNSTLQTLFQNKEQYDIPPTTITMFERFTFIPKEQSGKNGTTSPQFTYDFYSQSYAKLYDNIILKYSDILKGVIKINKSSHSDFYTFSIAKKQINQNLSSLNHQQLSDLISAVCNSSRDLIDEILNSYIGNVRLNTDHTDPSSTVITLHYDNALQYLLYNLKEVLHSGKVASCLGTNCKSYVIVPNSFPTLKDKCCPKCYAAVQKREYRRKHNTTN